MRICPENNARFSNLMCENAHRAALTLSLHLVRLTEVRGKVLIEKYAYKSVKTALLFSNVIDADHQNSCLFTNKGHFSLPLCVLIGVLAKFHE